jgi:hypothetical protein
VFAGLVDVGAFDTPLLQTPGYIAVHNMNTLTLLISLLILFYTVESLQRERSTGFAAIHDTTPIGAFAILLGKCLTNVVLGLAVVFVALLGFAIVMLVQGKVPFSLGPFALVWGLLLVPTFLVWTAFVCMTFALTKNRIGAYVIGLAAISLTGFFEARDKMSWTFNWDLWSAVNWSDLSVFELDRVALVLNRVMVLRAHRVLHRRHAAPLHAARRRRRALGAAAAPARAGRARRPRSRPIALLPLACAVALAYMVHGGREGAAARKSDRDYWAKNVLTVARCAEPAAQGRRHRSHVEPDRGWLHSKGEYTLLNRTDDTLRQVALTGGRHWKKIHWTMEGRLGEARRPRAALRVHAGEAARARRPGPHRLRVRGPLSRRHQQEARELDGIRAAFGRGAHRVQLHRIRAAHRLSGRRRRRKGQEQSRPQGVSRRLLAQGPARRDAAVRGLGGHAHPRHRPRTAPAQRDRHSGERACRERQAHHRMAQRFTGARIQRDHGELEGEARRRRGRLLRPAASLQCG